ncbi:allantoate amidohydrolase [Nakamurella leprariae]|uniref:Allantoate amidohydrolase n=1 Tax=Nakamurella leprariae TaxID=2803911 RepID=A0A938Y7X7_9ACTN|nr:allantoate amidohydrolase [Nakamurella leprariae]MBM9467475.1 allantoate amidohydrolase [Nakamurella leprariae]
MTPPGALDALADLDDLAEVGRDRDRGGYSRHLWDDAELELREWFRARATALGLDVEQDRNGNLWAWWGQPGPGALVTGSHLDSVPGGGAFDGPLGVVSALEAVGRLRRSGVRPERPVAVVAFAEEEGARFGIACLGSRLMTGSVDPARARALIDGDDVTLEQAGRRCGFDTDGLGPDPERVGWIEQFIELHIEQGRGLVDQGSAVGVASGILAHGRWALSFHGQGNHAGTTPMSDRDDPMIAAAQAVLAVQRVAGATSDGRATVGRMSVVPGGTNVIPSEVRLWVDVRSATDVEVRSMVAEIAAEVGATSFRQESWSGAVTFDPDLAARVAGVLGDVPILPTGAGHDAGVLSESLPTAMVFVRNPSGISHAPGEFAEAADCAAGVAALETALRDLLR